MIPLFNLIKSVEPIKSDLISFFSKTLDNCEFTSGKATQEFEKQFAKLCNTKYSLGVGSGTASLILALKTLGIKRGDEVITTPATFIATIDSILHVGAKPVFCDVEEETGNIDPREMEKNINSKTKAVLVVHLYGVPAKIDKIKKICQENNLFLIEDASHAHGSLYSNIPVGSFGDFGCFSLYPSKTLGALGNAGVLTSNNPELIELSRMYAHHGIKKGRHKYEHHISGTNELIDNLQAGFLLIKMKELKKNIAKKLEIAEIYNCSFRKHSHSGMTWSEKINPSLYTYSIQLKNREKMQKICQQRQIETGIYYPIPAHLQKSLSFLNHQKGDFPKAELFFDQTLSLPLYPELTKKQITIVSKAIHEYFS